MENSLFSGVKILVFDFDGTLVDSNPLKRKAFEACFTGADFSGRREEILGYCWGNHHTPRGEKFRYVYERILRQAYTGEIEKALHERFERETTQEIIRAPEIPGASEFLARVRASHRMAVLSSTPHAILRTILDHRGWAGYFDLKQGAPVDKASWLKGLQVGGVAPDQVLFFGDTPEDAAAAEEAGCRFISVPQMGDFHELLRKA